MSSYKASVFALALVTPALAQSCDQWTNAPSPSPGTTANLLIDVAAVRQDLAIAVGNWSGGAPARQPMIVRWNGSDWSNLPLPSTSALGTAPSIDGVGRSPSGDIWVVGYVRTPYPTNQMPLLLRFRNDTWDSVTTPTLRPQNTYPFAARGGLAFDTTAITDDDIWVVGSAVGYGDASATSVPLALHFDGSSWHDVPVPLVGNRSHSLNKVSASSSRVLKNLLLRSFSKNREGGSCEQ